MTDDGLVRGWYPITETEFDGTETSFTLPDCDVPLQSVTVDTDNPVKQFMAAVWSKDTPWNMAPWASASLVSAGDGYYRWWSMPTQTWTLHYGKGVFLTGLTNNLNSAGAAANPPSPLPPVVTPVTLNWQATIANSLFTLDCAFFDFNWVSLIAPTAGDRPVRIEVIANPTGSPSPLLAKVLGIPTAVGPGNVRFDTIRILKNKDLIESGDYEFTFKIYNQSGLSTNVAFTLTVQ